MAVPIVMPVSVADHGLVPPTHAPQAAGSRWRRLISGVALGCKQLFGLLTLIAALAIVAAIPIVQLISLGYLLEIVGRMTRERHFRVGFIGFTPAAAWGTIALAAWLIALPLRVIASMVANAELVAPEAPPAGVWQTLLLGGVLLAVVHLGSAIYRGGRVRDFLWPAPRRTWRIVRSFITLGEVYFTAVERLTQAVVDLRLGYFFWLGVRGFCGSLAWLALPVTLIAVGQRIPLWAVVGGLSLTIVAQYLPFLQAQYAAENRWSALFDLRSIRQRFKHAPVMFALALTTTLALSLPLNLLKVEFVPREAAWLPSLFFVAFNLPARWITGWAMLRAARRTTPVNSVVCWFCRGVTLLVASAYAAVVYATQFTAWNGISSLYEQHAFLVPVPFLGQ